jgi:hypothetical protein
MPFPHELDPNSADLNIPYQGRLDADLPDTMSLPVPKGADEAWCKMVSRLLGGAGYKTTLYHTTYITSYLDNQSGHRYNLISRPVTFLDEAGHPEEHTFEGTFVGADYRPDYEIDRPSFKKLPFAVLEGVLDEESKGPLELPDKKILVPLSGTVHLMLTRQPADPNH